MHTPSLLLLCGKLGVLTAVLHVSVIYRKEGSTEHRSPYLRHTTSLTLKIYKTVTLN